MDGDALKPEYDAAHVIMGGNWKMPTESNFNELLEGTTNEWVENYQGSGVNGRLFTSKTNGNTMFIPAAGYRDGSSVYDQGVNGNVWSSFSADDPYSAWALYFESGRCYMDGYYGYRVLGSLVRGVIKR